MNIAVLASGQGSNFKAVVNQIEAGNLRNAQVKLLISNNSQAGAFGIAETHQLPVHRIEVRQVVIVQTF